MGRRAKRTNPLQGRASRVKKARRTYTKRTLPSWYYRVLKLRWETSYFDEFKDPRDFDEDLSELEEESQQEGDVEQLEEGVRECECGDDDSECDCEFSDDEESERSYDGSDGDNHLGYYDLKEQREERKRYKLHERQRKAQQVDYEKSKEEEVRAAYKSLRKAGKKNKKTPLQTLKGQKFHLFCCDHVNHFYECGTTYVAKRVTFYGAEDYEETSLDELESDLKESKSGDKAKRMYGELELDNRACLHFGPFRARTHASGIPVKVKDTDRKFKLSFQFISNKYLKLRVSRDAVFMGSYDKHPGGPPTTAPEFFNMFGILRDPEEDKAEQERILMEERLRRPRSPRESERWFKNV